MSNVCEGVLSVDIYGVIICAPKCDKSGRKLSEDAEMQRSDSAYFLYLHIEWSHC